MTDLSLSVVIRCYNEALHIGKLLHGLGRQSMAHEVIVVDSGSTDETVSLARSFGVTLVEIRPEDFSFGRALNIGCQAATGDVLIFASAHVYPSYTSWLERMVVPFADAKVGAVYGKQRGNDTTKFSEHQIFEHWFPDDGPAHQEEPFCNNANCAISRAIWEQLPYDEMLTGLEDLAWAKQVTELGYRIVYAPLAEVVHEHDEPPRQVYRRYMREAMALRQIYPGQNMSLFDVARLFASNTASDYAHAAVDGALTDARNLWEIPTFRLMQFLGAYQGFRSNLPISEQLRCKLYYPRGLPRRRARRPVVKSERIVYP